MWDHGWDNLFKHNEWGQYPPEELIRFMYRNFGKAPDKKKITCLEVGCGPGANLWYLAREGFTVYGIDGSKIAVDKARVKLSEDGLRAEISVGDILKLPFPDNRFDCVLDIECIYANSMKDSKLIIGEIKRVLRQSGIFFSKTFMTGTYEGALHKDYGIIRFTSEADISELYSGLEIVNIDYVIRSDKNRKYEIKEWLITCRKS